MPSMNTVNKALQLVRAVQGGDHKEIHAAYNGLRYHNWEVRSFKLGDGEKVIEVHRDFFNNFRCAFVNRDTSLCTFFQKCSGQFNSDNYERVFGDSELPARLMDNLPEIVTALCNANGCSL